MADKLIRVANELAKALLRPFSAVVFSRDVWVGALVLAAVASFPQMAVGAMLSVVVAAAATIGLGFGWHAVEEGSYGCTAVLTTLAIGAFAPEGGHAWLLVVTGAVVAVLLSASFEAVFAPVALPTHSLPFVVSTWIVLLAARSLPATAAPQLWHLPAGGIPIGWYAESVWDIPAALLFVHGIVAGVLVTLAIGLHSRISLLLATLGAAVAVGMHWAFRSHAPWSMLDTTAAFNAVLTCIAVGGIWFVPHPTSIAFGAGAAAVSAVLTYALFPLASVAYLPVVSLPFVVTTHLILTAARRRIQDRLPRSAIPADRPESALAQDLMRARRFGDAAWIPFRLPFRGEWVVCQGWDGEHTHKEQWRHGIDFEVQGLDGRTFEREGKELRDYWCYGLPLLAAGQGMVALVVDGVPDNRVGETNTRDNWGNAVVVAHGAGLHSVYAHLQPKTIRVKAGDAVSTGMELGRCGNSGRSGTPHLHFQVQRAIPLGSPTIAADFGDVIARAEDGWELLSRCVPQEGQRVRAIVRDESLARAIVFVPGSEVQLHDQVSKRREIATVQIDLLGRTVIQSPMAKLYVEPYDAGLLAIDFHGSPSSLLRFLLLGLARLPFDHAPSLQWQDSLPMRLLLPGWLRAGADLVAAIAPSVGSMTVAFYSRRVEGWMHVHGRAGAWFSHTKVNLGTGSHQIDVEYGRQRASIRVDIVDPTPEAME